MELIRLLILRKSLADFNLSEEHFSLFKIIKDIRVK